MRGRPISDNLSHWAWLGKGTKFSVFFLALCFGLSEVAFALRQTSVEERIGDRKEAVGSKADLIAKLQFPSLGQKAAGMDEMSASAHRAVDVVAGLDGGTISDSPNSRPIFPLEQFLFRLLDEKQPVPVYVKRLAKKKDGHHFGAWVSLTPDGRTIGFIPMSNFVSDPEKMVNMTPKLHRLLWHKKWHVPILAVVERRGHGYRSGEHLIFVFKAVHPLDPNELAHHRNRQHSGMEEQKVDEDELLKYIDRADSPIWYEVRGQWRIHRKNLEEVAGKERTDQILPHVERYPYEIYAVEDKDIQYQGVFYSETLGCLFVGKEVWRSADLSLLKVLLRSGDKDWKPLRQWALQSLRPRQPPVTVTVAKATAPSSPRLALPQTTEPSLPSEEHHASASPPSKPVVPPLAPHHSGPALGPEHPSSNREGKEAVVDSIRRTAENAFAGKILPNTTGVIKPDFTQMDLVVWHDATEPEIFGGGGMLILSGLPRPMPLAPALRPSMKKFAPATSTRYRIRFSPREALESLMNRHPRFRGFEAQISRGLGEVLEMLEQPKRRWIEGTAQQAMEIAKKEDGAFDAWRSEDPERADGLLDKIREFHKRRRDLNKRLMGARKAFRSYVPIGKIPAEQVKEILSPLEAALAPWLRVQVEISQHLRWLTDAEDGGGVEIELFQDLVHELIPEAVRQQEWLVLISMVPPKWREVLYDAYRKVWQERLAALRSAAQTQPHAELDDAVLEVHEISRWLVQNEWNAALTYHLSQAIRDGSFETREETAHAIVQTGGVLFVDADDRPRRFVPGGGAVFIGGELTSRYFPFQIQQWFQPEDRVALIYPSLTGSPSLEHLESFIEDWFLLSRTLPGTPPIWLGTLTKDGTLRLYRPKPTFKGQEGWQSAFESIEPWLNGYGRLRTRLEKTLYKPPDTVMEQHAEFWENAKASARNIALRFGKRLPRRKTVEKAIEKSDPLVVWLNQAKGEILARFKEGLQEGFDSETVDALVNEVRTQFRTSLEELANVKDTNRLKEEIPALTQKIQMWVAERIGNALLAKDPFMEPVLIDGVSAIEPPSFQLSMVPHPGPLGRDTVKPTLSLPDLEVRIGKIVHEFMRRAKIRENQRHFEGASEDEIRAFAQDWVREKLETGERKPSFAHFAEAFKAQRTKPKPTGPTPEELARQMAQTLRDQLDAQLAQIPLRLNSMADVEQAQQVIANLDQHLPQLEAVPDLSSDVARLRMEKERLQGLTDQARRRLEREERDLRRKENDEILQKSRDAQRIARTILEDDRFMSFVDKDEEIRGFLNEVSSKMRPLERAQTVENKIRRVDPRKIGNFERQFHEALRKLIQLIRSSSYGAGLEEDVALEMDMRLIWKKEGLDSKVKEALKRRGWAFIKGQRPQEVGLIIAHAAPMSDIAGVIIADSDLENQEAMERLPWVRAGKKVHEVIESAQRLPARHGDLVVFEKSDWEKENNAVALLSDGGLGGVPVLVGDKETVAALPAVAFQVFASELRALVVLEEVRQFKDRDDGAYTLVWMA